MYSKLNKIVSGKNLLVIGPGGRIHDYPSSRQDELILRFNNDREASDIWATTFHGDVDAQVPAGTRFVLITVPNAVVSHWNPISENQFQQRDFRPQIQSFNRTTEYEIVNSVHWSQLAAAMPLFPLSGIVAISMLQYTNIKKCQIYGFDFYSANSLNDFLVSGPQKVTPTFPYMGMHSYQEAISFLMRLVISDERFEWHGKYPLRKILAIWERRKHELFMCYQVLRMAKKIKSFITVKNDFVSPGNQ